MEKAQLLTEGPKETPLSPSLQCDLEQKKDGGVKKILDLCCEKETNERKEEFNSKLSDSACCSLNESEESGSKCPENESNLADDESDSLECDEGDDIGDSGEEGEGEEEEEEEEESVDNNTFNVINTENSESQEISELTNDDSSNGSKIKENEVQVSTLAGKTSENSLGLETASVGEEIDSESEKEFPNSEEVKENTDSSLENISGREVEDSDSSIEDEESSRSKTEDQTENSEDQAMEVSADSPAKDGDKADKADKEDKADKTQTTSASTKSENTPKETQAQVKSTKPSMIPNPVLKTDGKPPKTGSPKIRKRLGPFTNNAKNNDFKIEIFESKRKPDHSITSTEDNVNQPDTTTLKQHEPPKQHETSKQPDPQNQITPPKHLEKHTPSPQPPKTETTPEKSLESPQSSDKLNSSDQSTSTPDPVSPDSGDRTSSMMLDVSQVIKEESEESDALSPIRSLVEDLQPPAAHLSPADTQDTTRKKQQQQQDPKIPTLAPSPQPLPTPTLNTPNTPNTLQNTPQNTPKNPPTTENTLNSSKSPSSSKKTPTLPTKSPRSSDKNDSTESAIELKKSTPMAFTVDLDSTASDSDLSANSAKKFDITASISQWAPKHRRNLSLTKVEEHKKVEEKPPGGSEKPPLGRPRSGTVGSLLASKRAGAGYHSEGYFSSDQDEDGPKRTDLKSPRSPRTPDTPRQTQSPSLHRSNSHESTKENSVRMRPPSPLSPTSPYAAPLTEAASFLIEKMMSATPETKRKQSTKSEGRACCKERERKPSVSELTGKSYKTEKKMGSDGKRQPKNTPHDDLDAAKDDKDDVSEAGTYTIDKDSPEEEEEEEANHARPALEGVLGGLPLPEESEAEGASTTTAVPMSSATERGQEEEESSWMSASEMPPPTLSRNSPNWIQQWAAHVAEQTKPPLDPLCPLPLDPLSPLSKPSPTPSPRGHKQPLSTKESELRPRRKLPTLPSHLASGQGAVSPRGEGPPSSSAKHRARMDKTKAGGNNPAFRNASFESHESGADSDFDTSVSYPFNEDERMSASLKSKLRLTGLLPAVKNIPSPSAPVASPRRPTEGGTVKDPKLKGRGEVGMRDPGYDIYNPRRDDRAPQSDSSSEASEPYKDVARSSDNNPPLKFNRAFSLRRARLGCEDPVASNPPVEKKRPTRPSSAGTPGSTRKTPLGTSKSYQSVDSPSGLVKSPSKSSIRKEPSHKKSATRSNSTLSSKEVDFQNWKRRKNYDPMKAAAEGKKKQVPEKKGKSSQPSTQNNSSNRTTSPPGNLLRSASFHGTEGVLCNVRWTSRKTPNTHHSAHYTSEDDGPYSYEEEIGPHPSPLHGSPLHRSPTSPHQLCHSPARHLPPSAAARARRPSLGHSDEGEPPMQYQAAMRKISVDESGSEGKRSPMNGIARGGAGAPLPPGGAGGRPKTKMEALDNLVISTIHSMSVKVRTTSESLLQKLKSQYDEEGDRAALLEEVLSHLSESDQSLTSGQTRSTSRELAGILRNLKKIEHALEVIDRVIVLGEDDYRDEDDMDYVPTEWVQESDY